MNEGSESQDLAQFKFPRTSMLVNFRQASSWPDSQISWVRLDRFESVEIQRAPAVRNSRCDESFKTVFILMFITCDKCWPDLMSSLVQFTLPQTQPAKVQTASIAPNFRQRASDTNWRTCDAYLSTSFNGTCLLTSEVHTLSNLAERAHH